VRLAALGVGSLFPLVAWIFDRKMGGERGALWSVILLTVIPVYNAFGVLATPDMPQLFLWVCMLVLTWKALESSNLWWWIGIGVLAAVVIIVKYIAILYFPALLLFLILSGQWRQQMRKPGVYLMMFIGAALVILLILFVGPVTFIDSIKYHLEERQVWQIQSLRDFFLYYLAHVAYFSPLIFALALAGMAWAGWTGWTTKNPKLLFLFCFSVTPWFFFSAITALTERELNREHWDSPAYICAVIAAVALMERKGVVRRNQRWLIASAAIAGVTLLGGVFEAFTTIPSRLFHQRPAFASLQGWKRMSSVIDEQMSELPKSSFLLMNSFPLLVEHNFYTKRHDRMYTLHSGRDKRYGIAVVWEESHVSEKYLSEEQGRDGLFVHYEYGSADLKEKSARHWVKNLQDHFTSVDFLANAHVGYGSTIIRSYFFLEGKNLKSLFGAEKMKSGEKNAKD
jgi:hypothetical protein